jgi:hypothetical protein
MPPVATKARLPKGVYAKIGTHEAVEQKIQASLIGGFWFERCTEGDLPNSRVSTTFARNKEFGKLCISFLAEPNTTTPCDPALVGLDSDTEDEVHGEPDVHFFIFPGAIMLQLPNGKQMPIVRPFPHVQSVKDCDTLELLVVTEILHESGADAAGKAFRIHLPVHLCRLLLLFY